MADFIISPYAISFDSIKNNLISYLKTKPDAERWQDFYVSSAGETVIEIAAALGAFYAYQFITGRRESFLSVAQNYSSAIGLAQNLGYCASRGDNLKLRIHIVPNQTIALSKWDVIGSYTEYDVVLMEDVILNEGIGVNVEVAIGNLLRETQYIQSNKLTQFIFTNNKVTDTCRLLLNDKEIPSSTAIKDALDDKYIMLSNVLGAVDVFYLNNGDYQYKAGDELQLEFIERNNITNTNYSHGNITIDYAKQVNHYTVTSQRIEKEDMDTVKINAPIHHETSALIRSRKDYCKHLLSFNKEIKMVNDYDIYPGLIAVTYLKKDMLPMTTQERNEWLSSIRAIKPSGVADAIIIEPAEVRKHINIQIWKEANKTLPANLSEELDKILAKYENIFGPTLDFNQIEHDIERLEGVKVARAEFPILEWKPNTYYDPYDMVTFSITSQGKEIYYNQGLRSVSGDTPPNWDIAIPTYNGLRYNVPDNNLLWEYERNLWAITLNTWKPGIHIAQWEYTKIDREETEEDGEVYEYEHRFRVKHYIVQHDTMPNFNSCEPYVYHEGSVWKYLGKDNPYRGTGIGCDYIKGGYVISGNYEDGSDRWALPLIAWVGKVIAYYVTEYDAQGNIITEGYRYYVCVTIRGCTGAVNPEIELSQTPLVDHQVFTDNATSWTRIRGNIGLKWNEYLRLTKSYTIMG